MSGGFGVPWRPRVGWGRVWWPERGGPGSGVVPRMGWAGVGCGGPSGVGRGRRLCLRRSGVWCPEWGALGSGVPPNTPKHIPDRFRAIWQLFETFDFFDPKIDLQITISAVVPSSPEPAGWSILAFPVRLFPNGIENLGVTF